jgi:putative N6-adenine-specific DNA methylase
VKQNNEQRLFLAKTFFGLEDILAAELKAIGASEIQVLKRAVSFRGDLKLLYRANLELRSALRILQFLGTFEARDPDALYRGVKAFNWLSRLKPEGTFAIDSVVNSPFFRHSKYATFRTKDAIADQFIERKGKRPSIDLERPDLRLNLHIRETKVTLSFDSSGDSLHKRGYRLSKTEAPLNEALAAGLILQTGWQGDTPFIDPMCGSGTFLIEAAMIAKRQAPQKYREWFGFMTWPDFDEKLWEEVKAEAQAQERDAPAPILGSDFSNRALTAARQNLQRARLERIVRLRLKNFSALGAPPPPPGVLVTNPPYGERIGGNEVAKTYRLIGDQLKQHYAGYEAWVFSSNRDALKRVGLRPSGRLPFFNGALECRFVKFEMYEGSKKTES